MVSLTIILFVWEKNVFKWTQQTKIPNGVSFYSIQWFGDETTSEILRIHLYRKY